MCDTSEDSKGQADKLVAELDIAARSASGLVRVWLEENFAT